MCSPPRSIATPTSDGELRSAAWFASRGGDEPWVSFHLTRAAERVAAVEFAAGLSAGPRRRGRDWPAALAHSSPRLSFSRSCRAAQDARRRYRWPATAGQPTAAAAVAAPDPCRRISRRNWKRCSPRSRTARSPPSRCRKPCPAGRAVEAVDAQRSGRAGGARPGAGGTEDRSRGHEGARRAGETRRRARAAAGREERARRSREQALASRHEKDAAGFEASDETQAGDTASLSTATSESTRDANAIAGLGMLTMTNEQTAGADAPPGIGAGGGSSPTAGKGRCRRLRTRCATKPSRPTKTT